MPLHRAKRSGAMTVQVTITPNGRMSLPAEIRKRLGLTGGGALLVEETEDGVILRTVAQSVAHAQALARKYTAVRPEASVDAFLARRREESGE
jgi:AbrB family looped-hinge helix DNA binding protein